jgi:hypothetical protein
LLSCISQFKYRYQLVMFGSLDPAWFPHLMHGVVRLPAHFYNIIQMIKSNTQMITS